MKFIIIEDNLDHQIIIKNKIKEYSNSVKIDTAFNLEESKVLLSNNTYALILLDYRLKGSSGIDIIKWLKKKDIDTPIIMITSLEEIELAVNVIKLGAYDYICKNNESLEKLPFIIEKVLEEYNLKKKLKETEFKYHALVEMINEAVYLLNKNGQIFFASCSVKRILGYSSDELKDQFDTILKATNREIFFQNMNKIISGIDIEPFVLEINKKDGSKIYIELNESQFIENGKVKGIIGTMQDVTQRVLLEKEIQSEKEKVVDIFNSMVDRIYIVDEDFNVQFANKSLLSYVGTFEGKKCYVTLYNRKTPCPFCKWINIKNGYTVRWELIREDGKTFDVISSPIKNSDGSIHKMEILRDITKRKESEVKYKIKSEEAFKANKDLKRAINELKQTQEQLVQSEKLAAIGKLVSGIAHELNNPLFAAMGYTELLLMDSEADNKSREKLEDILSSINRARNVVNGLLEFSRSVRVEKEIIDINKVISQTLSLREFEFKVSGIALECNLEKGLLPVVGNPVRLQQVFLNILINAEQAIKEVGKKGFIKVRSYMDKDQKMIFVEISDNAKEIPNNQLGKIFDPFFTTKEVGSGTGLGLSISYGIIKDYNGTIDVKSNKNLTSFIVGLPYVEVKPKTNPKLFSKKVDIKTSGKSVLVVDDETVIVSMLKDFFERKGFSVLTAKTGNEALKRLKNQEIELIILDIRMPEMDGKGFYKIIKSKRPELIKKIIFVTGDTLNTETLSFLEQINGYYLKKPFSFNEIADAINSVTGK